MRPTLTTPKPQARREAGSAFILTLVALLILTIVGISLSLISETEMRTGENERSIQRVFYATDSGTAVATARALTIGTEPEGQSLTLEDAGTGFARHLEVEVSPFYPILAMPCNLCEINDAGTYSSNAYQKITHAVTSRGTRVATATDEPLAQKTISEMVEVQPKPPSTEGLLPLMDPAALDKIKF